MFVFAFAVMGRASDVTTYSPLIERIEFPRREVDYSADGYPHFLTVVYTQWKGRRKTASGYTDYRMRLHRNFLCTSLCPVVWLMTWLLMDGRKEGPIFAHNDKPDVKMPQEQYTRMMKRMFEHAGTCDGHHHLIKCTSHSIRRTAAQVCSAP
jgi:hypothetical protein